MAFYWLIVKLPQLKIKVIGLFDNPLLFRVEVKYIKNTISVLIVGVIQLNYVLDNLVKYYH